MAITAWSAKVCTSASCVAVTVDAGPADAIAPMAAPSRSSGMPTTLENRLGAPTLIRYSGSVGTSRWDDAAPSSRARGDCRGRAAAERGAPAPRLSGWAAATAARCTGSPSKVDTARRPPRTAAPRLGHDGVEDRLHFGGRARDDLRISLVAVCCCSASASSRLRASTRGTGARSRWRPPPGQRTSSRGRSRRR